MSPADRTSDPSCRGRARERTVLHRGVQWRVWEGCAGAYDRRGGPHLFFDSDLAVRRVRDFPPNWYELPNDELMAVSERR